MFKKYFCFALLLSVIGFYAAIPARAAEGQSLTKADVEKIVGDYIMNNPQKILDSVEKYQEKSETDNRMKALEKHKQALFNDIGSPETGNPDGDVTVIEFFDYNCGYCKKTFSAVQDVLDKDKNVRFVFKEFPILGLSSEKASRWALAANMQKKYFEFHKKLMSNKKTIDDALLERFAKEVGLDVDRARKDAEGAEVTKQIEDTRTLATGLNLGGTPAFVIGDEVVPGMIFAEDMLKKIAAARGKKAKN